MSPYRPPWGFSHAHLQTVYPTLFRRIRGPVYQAETLTTEDDDFLDLSWLRHPAAGMKESREARPLAVLAHGMEGSSQAIYMRGMARAFFAAGWDVLAWNMRGCGGRPNALNSFYHSGKTDDLEAVIRHARPAYARLALIGFSLGGNVVLKYLGEQGKAVRDFILGAAVISVPCDLAGCAEELARKRNFIYLQRFLHSFRGKIRAKMKSRPGAVNDQGFGAIQNFRDFDNRYTAPDFGYPDAETYWRANSSLAYLPNLAIPCLMLSSADDPFLSPGCLPRAIAEKHPSLLLEISHHGGHCGFLRFARDGHYYSEIRCLEFLAFHRGAGKQ